ncbi:acyl-CoA desaturase [Amycolatopsis mongoliensis]|uniref:Acyl-CoA desaturase n=1 Tax=Amycolatopsis mongoliensis TaxID=715475 RepID=A0A9Y2JLG8_9PSEU|nr:acyl-CoA desaturase [Amycolatopsis sp. 4-36]WIY00695.1 acyl-CoA desaturase [Amycolatopsis sp. 4-36]
MTATEHPFAHLSENQLAELAREFDAIHDQVRADLGERDRRYIKGVIRLHRQIAVAGRALLLGSRSKVAWTAGTGCLAIAKILENMEIGHNVLHGQWDWMNDPCIHSSTWDWDTASTAAAWKHSHNYIHHTYTNIRGKDKDLGYEIMRIDPHQKWHPAYLAQPLYNLLLMAFFEWGVAVHDMDVEAIRAGEKPMKDVWHDIKGISGKARDQILKDYVGWPLVSALAATAVGRLVHREPRSRARVLADRARGRRRKGAVRARLAAARAEGAGTFAATFWADFTANIIRNLWAHSIIFCGHFPDQTYTFSQDEVRDETRGGWYVRQLVGAANITGSPLFHLLSGNLGYQVEHHLFPDMPSSRYAEIASQVREICRRYGLPYNTGPLSKQLGTVHRTILRLAFPGGKVRPKPGPYRGDELERAA